MSKKQQIEDALESIQTRLEEEAFKNLCYDLRHNFKPFISADGSGVEFAMEGIYNLTVRRTWAQLFKYAQDDVDTEHAFACLEMAEQGVLKVKARLKALRKKLEKRTTQ